MTYEDILISESAAFKKQAEEWIAKAKAPGGKEWARGKLIEIGILATNGKLHKNYGGDSE